MERNKLYKLIFVLYLLGLFWIISNLFVDNKLGFIETTCVFKLVMDIPCPSCGTTRSIMTIIEGNFINALYINPFGLLMIIIMVTIPIWLIIDIIKSTSSFLIFYNNIEKFFQRKEIAFISVILVIINWIWNISKGL